jgi:thiamine pyrophosphate-dependent acetolactate synthase large subunit-like protein
MVQSVSVHLDGLPVPVDAPGAPEWGSDVVAAMLVRLGVEYVALTPGSSFRGLHDSLINYLGNRRPSIILCNHEEVAVSVAHGFAKASHRPMAAAVHSNVGLLHASMAIFNAWVDRTPVFVLGGTGPLDSTLRRPWIDWVHSSQSQGQVVRDFTKWEHQPASVAAIPEAMLRAWHAMLGAPCGPVYFNLDVTLQEQRLGPAAPVRLADPTRYPLAAPQSPDAESLANAAEIVLEAESRSCWWGEEGRPPRPGARLSRWRRSLARLC